MPSIEHTLFIIYLLRISVHRYPLMQHFTSQMTKLWISILIWQCLEKWMHDYVGGVGWTIAVVVDISCDFCVDVDADDVQILTDVIASLLCRWPSLSLTEIQVLPPRPTPTTVDVRYDRLLLLESPSMRMESVSTQLSLNGGSSLLLLCWWDLKMEWKYQVK